MKNTLYKHVLFTEVNSVQNLCKPLLNLGITGFIFMRRYKDGSLVDLSNNLKWSEHYLLNYLDEKYSSDSIRDHVFLSEGVSLWDFNEENIIWQEGREFGYGNGISIVFQKKNYTDIFGFYSGLSNTKINQFYLNHMDILFKFCDYFVDAASDIINKGKKSPLYIPNKYNSLIVRDNTYQNRKVKEFLSQIGDDRGVINPHIEAHKLTPRESECIKWVANGLTAKQIARKLSLSFRTVENYLEDAKRKLGCINVTHLVYVFMANCNLIIESP